jgi:hypothetical protein
LKYCIKKRGCTSTTYTSNIQATEKVVNIKAQKGVINTDMTAKRINSRKTKTVTNSRYTFDGVLYNTILSDDTGNR